MSYYMDQTIKQLSEELEEALEFYASRTVFYEKSLFPGDYAKIDCTHVAEEVLKKV